MAGQVEDDRIPGGGRDGIGVLVQTAPAEIGTGVLRGFGDGPGHFRLVQQTLHAAAGDQTVVDALVLTHIGILQIHQLQTWMRPFQPVPPAIALQDLEFGDPVEFLRQVHGVVAQPCEHRLPTVEDVGGVLPHVGTVTVLHVLACLVQVLPLDLQSRHFSAVTQTDTVGQTRVLGDRPQIGHGCLQGQVLGKEAVLDHRQDQRGRAELEIGGQLAHVGVTDDHVQPSVTLRIGVGLVPGVDDGPLERGLQADLHLEEVGTLGQLEARTLSVGTRTDLARPADHLARDEERDEVPDDVAEGRRPVHQIVLVTAVRGTLVVGVVLVQLDRIDAGGGPGPGGCVGHHPLPRLVPQHRITRIGDLGGGVLGVGVVHVETCTVGEDDVGQPQILVGQLRGVGDLTRHVEAARIAQRVLLLEIPAGSPRPGRRGCEVGVDHLGGGDHRVRPGIARHGDPVLGLDTHDPPHTHAERLSARGRS